MKHSTDTNYTHVVNRVIHYAFLDFFFCLADLFIDEIGVLNSPIIIVLKDMSPFRSINICFK